MVCRGGYGLEDSGVRVPAGAKDYSVFYNVEICMKDSHKHNKYLIVYQSWAAIDNYMFRPSGGHRQVVHSEVEYILY